MPVTVVKGPQLTYDTAQSATYEYLEEVIAKKIFLEQPEINKTVLIHRRAQDKYTETIGARKFKVVDDKYLPVHIKVSGAHSAVGTTLTVVGNFLVQYNKLLYRGVLGDEIIFLGASSTFSYNSGTDVLTISLVTRGAFGTTAQSIPDGSLLKNLGDTAEDLSESRDSVSTKPYTRWQYSETKRESLDISGFNDVWEKKFMVDQLQFKKNKKLIEIKTKIEHNVLFSHGYEEEVGTVGSNSGQAQRYSTWGFVPWMKNYAPAANIIDINGTFTRKKLEKILSAFDRRQEGRWVIFCGDLYIRAVAMWARAPMRTSRTEATYGNKIEFLESPMLGSNVRMIYHPALDIAEAWDGTTEMVKGAELLVMNINANSYVKGKLKITHGDRELLITDTAVLPIPRQKNYAGYGHEFFWIGGIKWRDEKSQAYAYGGFDFEE